METGITITKDDLHGAYIDESGALILPEGVTRIDHSVFENCSALVSVVIPDGVTEIDWRAFANCENLTTVVIPDSVTKIGNGLFSECRALRSVTLGSGITEIPKMCFQKCTGLDELFLPDSVTAIRTEAFDCCWVLELSGGLGVREIEGFAFPIGFQVSFPLLGARVEDGVLIIPDGTATIPYGAFRDRGDIHTVILPEGVREIRAHAFNGCGTLEKLVLPDSLRTLGSNAFYYCKKLASVSIGTGVEEIPHACFSSCSGLETVGLSVSVCSIGDYAFQGCGALKTVTGGAGVRKIGYKAFKECPQLSFLEIPEEILEERASVFDGETVPNLRNILACYRYTDTPADGAIMVENVGAFLSSPVTEEEMALLSGVCEGWMIEVKTVSGLDTSMTELGYGGLSTEYSHKPLYPCHALLKDGEVIGFYKDGNAFLIGEEKVLRYRSSEAGEHPDTEYIYNTDTYLVKK